jgi:chromosome transmission fidelity protein 4
MVSEPPSIEKTVEGIIPIVIDTEYVVHSSSALEVLFFYRSSSDFLHDCSVVWHPSGQYFFVASKGHGELSWSVSIGNYSLCVLKEIITISRSDWSKTSTFSDKNVSGSITALAISPNGVYIASASQSRVHVWSTQTRRVIVRYG